MGGGHWRADGGFPGQVGQLYIRLQTSQNGTGNDVTKVTGRFPRVYSIMK